MSTEADKTEIKEEDQKQLFEQMYTAIQTNDQSKVNELVTGKKIEEVTPPSTSVDTTQDKKDEGVQDKKDATPEPKKDDVENKDEPKDEPKLSVEEQRAKAQQEWLSSLPEEHRAEAELLIKERDKERKRRKEAQQSYRSNAGRIAAYQRTINELRALEQERPLKEAIAAQPKEKDEDFETLAENDPKFAQYLKRREEKLVGNLSDVFEKRLQAIVKPLIEGREREVIAEESDYVQHQREIVKQYVPNVEQVVTSEQWKKWYTEEASDSQKQLVVSPHANDALAAIELYANWLVREGYVLPPSTDKKPEQSVQAPPPSDDRADKVAASRDRKSNQPVAAVGSQVVPPPSGKGTMDFDPVALFNESYNRNLPKRK